MIGRATLGNPWILKKHYRIFKKGKYDNNFPSNEEKIKTNNRTHKYGS